MLSYPISFFGDEPSIPWDLSEQTLEDKFALGGEPLITNIKFSSDGYNLFVIGTVHLIIYQYTLSVAFDISTAAYFNKFSVGDQITSASIIHFSPDGTKMYVYCGSVYQYTLSTAWDISTASYDNKNIDVTVNAVNTGGLIFKNDGTKMYINDFYTAVIYQYSLSTAWDVSTASYDLISFDIDSLISTYGAAKIRSLSSDGTKLIINTSNKALVILTLSTPYVLSTASYSVDNSLQIVNTAINIDVMNDGEFIFMYYYNNIKMYSLSIAWDISTEFLQTNILSSTSGYNYDIFFGNNGNTLYVINQSYRSVYQYTLSTAWDTSSATYASKFLSITSQETNPRGLFFSSDGTKMYVLGYTNDTVYQYTLSTAWDVSTGTYSSKNKSIATQDGAPYGLCFSSDGTKMYVLGYINKTVYQYTLSTAWDVSTASYASKSKTVSSETTTPWSVFIGSAGTKLYVISQGEDRLYQYTLSTAWDVSTASYDNKYFVYDNFLSSIRTFFFNPTGTILYISNNANIIKEYSLSTAWDVSTAVLNIQLNSSDFLSSKTTLFSSNGLKLYILFVYNSTISQYSLSKPYNISTAIYENEKSLATTSSISSFFITNNGITLFVLDYSAMTLKKYTLSTAWDISTASYDLISFDLTTIIYSLGSTASIKFNTDGTKLYISNADTIPLVINSIVELDLTIPWDISTISFNNDNLSKLEYIYDMYISEDGENCFLPSYSYGYIAAAKFGVAWDSTEIYIKNKKELAGISSLFFNPTGTILIYLNRNADTVYQYTLSTAWDISTANNTGKSFSVTTQENNPKTIRFNPAGTKMYVLGYTNDTVYQYTLSTAWDISTASYASKSFLATGQDATPYGIHFNPIGTKMYVLGYTTKTVYQYTLSTAWDISTASYASKSIALPTSYNSFSNLNFETDGNKMYICFNDVANCRILEYALSTAWDVSTAILTEDIQTSGAEYATGFTFNDNGTKIFVKDSNISIYQYTLLNPWDLSYVKYDNILFNSGLGSDINIIDEGETLITNYFNRLTQYRI